MYNPPLQSAIFVTLDFESWSPGLWWTLGFLVMEYASGKIVNMVDFACDRSTMTMSNVTRDFWNIHTDAFSQNIEAGRGRCVDEEELRICRFVTELKATRPDFYLVSDSPANDIVLLDNILLRHGYPLMSQRSPSIFRQVICTWSYRLAMSNMLCTTPQSIVTRYGHLIQKRDDIDSSVKERLVQYQNVPVQLGPPHTVMLDCFNIMLNHFKLLDIAHNINRRRRR
jgi:hypothetical protein